MLHRLTLFFAAGVFSFVTQAVLFREYLVIYGGSELAIGVFLGSWLLWVGFGAGLGRALIRWRPHAARLVPLVCCCYAAAPLLQLWLIRSFRLLRGVPTWEAFPLGDLLALTVVANAPISLAIGALFTIACAAVASRGSVAGNYVVEAGGSFVGGALVTLLVWRGCSALWLLGGAGGALLLAAALWAWRARSYRQLAAAALALATLAATGTWGVARWERQAELVRWRGVLPGAQLLAWCDTPRQHLAFGRIGEQRVVVSNGAVSAAFPDEPGYALEAAVVMTQRPGAARVLLIGDVATGLLRHLLAYGPREVTWLDDDPQATAFLRPRLLARDRAALADGRVRVVGGDPRAALRALDGRFQLIAVLVAEPDTALANRLFTRELYRELRRLLAADGAVVTRVRSEVNVLSREVVSFGASVDHTLRSVFPRVLAAPGERQWFFAGGAAAPVTLDGAEVARRYRRAPLRRRVFGAGELRGLWSPRRAAFVRSRYAVAQRVAGAALLNRDARPVAYFHGLVRRARTLDSRVGPWLFAAQRAGPLLWLLPLAVVGLLRLYYVAGRPRPRAVKRFNAVALVAVFGAAGMALQTILMIAFHSRVGAIFVEVGLVAGLFMVGLAGGGALLLRLARRRRPWPLVWTVVASMALALLVIPWGLSSLDGLALPGQRACFYALFLAVGAVSGAAFPLAAAVLEGGGQGAATVAARLEAADHLGGAVAALSVGVLMVPTLGVRRTAWVLLALLALLAAWLAQQQLAADGRQTRLGRWLAARARARSFAAQGVAFALVAVVLVAVTIAAVIGATGPRARVRFADDELRRLVGGERFRERERPFVHYLVDAKPGGEARAAAAASMAVAPDVRGFGGRLNVLVKVDRRGRLQRVALLQSQETPAYIVGLGRWLEGLSGRPITRPLRLAGPTAAAEPGAVDAVTGATITSEAVVAAVNRTGAALAEHGLGLAVQAAAAGGRSWRRLAEPALIYLLLALLAAVVAARWASDGVRLAFLGCNLVLGGLLFNTQLSLVDVERLLQLELPSPGNPVALALVVGAVLLALLFGPLYCGYLCPFGAAQELLGRLGLAGRLHHRLEDRARFGKYLLLAASAVTLLAGSDAPLAADPLSFHLGQQAPSGWAVALLLAIAVASLQVFRPWCRYLCPVGALLNLGNKLRLAGRWLRPRRYGSCDLGVDGPLDVDCLQCDRCVHRTTRSSSGEQLAADAPVEAER